MAIDSTIFAVDIPNGATLAIGDKYPMTLVYGSETVKAGYGNGKLMGIDVGTLAGSVTGLFRVHVKNSSWVDGVASFAGSVHGVAGFADDSGMHQNGAKATLEPNSRWEVYAECVYVYASPTTQANSVYAKIDIDFPSVSSVVAPDQIEGDPVTLTYDLPATTPYNANGAMTAATFQTMNVNDFKAGFKYCMERVETFGAGVFGIIAFEGAAGMRGLCRAVLTNQDPTAIRPPVRYSSILEQGPMTIKYMMFTQNTAGSGILAINIDYVKKKA